MMGSFHWFVAEDEPSCLTANEKDLPGAAGASAGPERMWRIIGQLFFVTQLRVRREETGFIPWGTNR